MNNASEQLLSDVVTVLSEKLPEINVERTKSILSAAISKYHIKKVEENEPHPDSDEKLGMFLSSKRLEGLSPLTLDGYELELRIFFRHVTKRMEAVTAADIRAYLGQFDRLKMSTVGRKLSVLKSFFGWLTAEEIIPRDPSARTQDAKAGKAPAEGVNGGGVRNAAGSLSYRPAAGLYRGVVRDRLPSL